MLIDWLLKRPKPDKEAEALRVRRKKTEDTLRNALVSDDDATQVLARNMLRDLSLVESNK